MDGEWERGREESKSKRERESKGGRKGNRGSEGERSEEGEYRNVGRGRILGETGRERERKEGESREVCSRVRFYNLIKKPPQKNVGLFSPSLSLFLSLSTRPPVIPSSRPHPPPPTGVGWYGALQASRWRHGRNRWATRLPSSGGSRSTGATFRCKSR